MWRTGRSATIYGKIVLKLGHLLVPARALGGEAAPGAAGQGRARHGLEVTSSAEMGRINPATGADYAIRLA
jgi:hypothetical protein